MFGLVDQVVLVNLMEPTLESLQKKTDYLQIMLLMFIRLRMVLPGFLQVKLSQLKLEILGKLLMTNTYLLQTHQ